MTVADCVRQACLWEATARKLGNVHPGAAFVGLTYADFVTSANVASESFRKTGLSVGEVIMASAVATRAAVGTNTNLGILLLLAPLGLAEANPSLRNGIRRLLEATTVADAANVFAAIRVAQPGGLGDVADQDVKADPSVTLLEAMCLAADRDLIAGQYANGFSDVFDFGVPEFLAGVEKFGRLEPAIIECHLKWMAEFPDSLIARKNGPAVAEDVQRRAKHVLSLGGLETAEGRSEGVALDLHLRCDGNRLNPGTSADLVAASLFVALRQGRISSKAPFQWDVEDWL